MIFLINNSNRKDCSLEIIKEYETDINFIIVYNSLIKYFGLERREDDCLYYYTDTRGYRLKNNGNNYYCVEEEDDFKGRTIMLKKFIYREIILKKLLE
jgi:pentatricopeptide repeat protein